MASERRASLWALACLAASVAPVAAVPGVWSPTTTYLPPAPTVDDFGIDAHNTYLDKTTRQNRVATLPNGEVSIVEEPTSTTSLSLASALPTASAGYVPSGGLAVNVSEPDYSLTSDYDKQSVILAMYQEWAQLDFLQKGFSMFTDQDYTKAGLEAADRTLLDHLAQQEAGHATAMNKLLDHNAPGRCSYNFPISNVREYVDFGQKITRWGESMIYGFVSHLESRAAAQVMQQSVSTTGRQQLLFRQWNGLHPMPVLFTSGIPQSWGWSFLAPYIASCNTSFDRIMWQNFPKLTIINQPNPARTDASKSWNETLHDAAGTQNTQDITFDQSCGSACAPAIAHNRDKAISYAGRDVFLQWDAPGEPVGPDGTYSTSTLAGAPLYAAWISPMNVTYTPLLDIQGNSAHTYQPNRTTYGGVSAVNGTMFIAITDANLTVTSFNRDALNPHILALGMYQAG